MEHGKYVTIVHRTKIFSFPLTYQALFLANSLYFHNLPLLNRHLLDFFISSVKVSPFSFITQRRGFSPSRILRTSSLNFAEKSSIFPISSITIIDLSIPAFSKAGMATSRMNPDQPDIYRLCNYYCNLHGHNTFLPIQGNNPESHASVHNSDFFCKKTSCRCSQQRDDPLITDVLPTPGLPVNKICFFILCSCTRNFNVGVEDFQPLQAVHSLSALTMVSPNFCAAAGPLAVMIFPSLSTSAPVYFAPADFMSFTVDE